MVTQVRGQMSIIRKMQAIPGSSIRPLEKKTTLGRFFFGRGWKSYIRRSSILQNRWTADRSAGAAHAAAHPGHDHRLLDLALAADILHLPARFLMTHRD